MTSTNNTLFVNKATNSVGINNSLPRYNLDVIGTTRVTRLFLLLYPLKNAGQRATCSQAAKDRSKHSQLESI